MLINIIRLVILALFISACSPCSLSLIPPATPTATAAKSINLVEQNRFLISQLSAAGVQVVQKGENLLIILSTDQAFLPHSSALNCDYRSVLDRVAILFSHFDEYGIRVSAYTDSERYGLSNLALSRQQARVIADYLWRAGVDTRLLMANGYGREWAASSPWSRRIEISAQIYREPDSFFLSAPE